MIDTLTEIVDECVDEAISQFEEEKASLYRPDRSRCGCHAGGRDLVTVIIENYGLVGR